MGANKYGAVRHEYKGRKFDSSLEMLRFIHLEDAQRRGKISDLKCQVPFLLIPAQYKLAYIKGKEKPQLVEREARYTADFTYIKDGRLVVEDTKGVETEAYVLRRKLMYQVHGLQIRQVKNPGEDI